MRPGRQEDLPRLIHLWREVRAGRQDIAPNEARLGRMLAKFDWEAKSRIVEGEGGRIAGAVLVTSRSSPEGLQATVHVASEPDVATELARWGTLLSRAAGAQIVQIFAARERQSFEEIGMRVARPWWRMDRSLEDSIPQPEPVPGYQLIDAVLAPSGAWGDMFNRSFADHWRFTPRSEEEVIADRPAWLSLMAVTETARVPAAITLGEIEHYAEDARPQPVGLVSSVGTVPEHRRRGLASWLVSEVLGRLASAGARSASLYVDGLNETRAFEMYRKLGFRVAFEASVWEATVP